MAHIITRRSFLHTGFRATAAAGFASMLNIPAFLHQALADGTIGQGPTPKKLLFIFLRGGNDGINNIIPINDPSYLGNRPVLALPKDPALTADYDAVSSQCVEVTDRNYPNAIPLRNGFAALHPALYKLSTLYNTGKLALVHRVGYRGQSRSHFDSERYWESAIGDPTSRTYPQDKNVKDGVWYRAVYESGLLTGPQPPALTGVSIQSNLPQSLRGAYPMTNLSSIGRYNLLGVYNPSGSTNADRVKILDAINTADLQPHPVKDNRPLTYSLGVQFRDTLEIFQDPTFSTNEFYDTDGTTHLFPINSASDQAGLGSGAYGFFQNLKSAAQVLANTTAFIAGTEMGGFDTHTAQVIGGAQHTGGHASLLRRIGWAFYALQRFFSNATYNNKGRDLWQDVVVVTMSEFGRTSSENASVGTDHAEASVMYLAGGSVRGGVYGCDAQPNPVIGQPNWTPGTGGKTGSMYAANSNVGYLKRIIDYRSVLGEIFREHLGATGPGQLERIIPGYGVANEFLLSGTAQGTSPIVGEIDVIT
jgi:uncharacterized protein (DUF1501 family)